MKLPIYNLFSTCLVTTIAQSIALANISKNTIIPNNYYKNKVYQYLEDESTCRSVFLLEYFGEKNGKNCGICSNCLTQTHSPKNDKQKIEADILQLLSYKPFNCNDLINTLPYSEQQINTVLDELFAMKKITFNIFNELCLK